MLLNPYGGNFSTYGQGPMHNWFTYAPASNPFVAAPAEPAPTVAASAPVGALASLPSLPSYSQGEDSYGIGPTTSPSYSAASISDFSPTTALSSLGDFVSDKATSAFNNPVAALTDVAVGFTPVLGQINTLSGLFGGPTVGGTLFGYDSDQVSGVGPSQEEQVAAQTPYAVEFDYGFGGIGDVGFGGGHGPSENEGGAPGSSAGDGTSDDFGGGEF